METYRVTFNENQDKGVYALSVVEDPAMEGMFIALNKDEEIKLAKVNEEQRILMGVALIPDKLIYRNQGGREFNITFSKETIKDIAHAFLKNGYQRESTIEHETPIDGVSVVESWIIEDEQHDKSRAYGFDYPIGSWMATMKVDNQEVWNDFVKTGKIKGFSIDGMFGLEKVNLNNANMSETKENSTNVILSAIQEIKALFTTSKEEFKEEVKFGSVQLENDVTVEFDGEVLEMGKEVYIKDEDENRVPLPNGDYKTLENFEFSVVDGIATEKTIEEVQEVKEDVVIKQSNEFDIKQALQDLLTQLNKDVDDKIAELEAKFSKQIEEKEKEIEELKKEPASKKIVHTAELSKERTIEPRTAQERILETLQNLK